MAEFSWDNIQGSYAWMAARQMTIQITMMLLDFEKWERNGGYNQKGKTNA